MSVVSIFGDDAEAEARALSKVAAWRNQQAAQPMREADRLLQTILEAGDLVGRDAAGRMVIPARPWAARLPSANGVRR
jgi:hypothetical protein